MEDVSLSHHAAAKVGRNDIYENLLIHGDNLLALKALEQDYAGKVKCIYIAPPLQHRFGIRARRRRHRAFAVAYSDAG